MNYSQRRLKVDPASPVEDCAILASRVLLILGAGESVLAFLSQVVDLPTDADDVAVLLQAIEDGGGDHGGSQDCAPLPEELVAGKYLLPRLYLAAMSWKSRVPPSLSSGGQTGSSMVGSLGAR